jgi:hypothetical protein
MKVYLVFMNTNYYECLGTGHFLPPEGSEAKYSWKGVYYKLIILKRSPKCFLPPSHTNTGLAERRILRNLTNEFYVRQVPALGLHKQHSLITPLPHRPIYLFVPEIF